MSNFQVILADWNQWQPQLHAIRREVFVREQGVPEEDEWDEKDATPYTYWHLSKRKSPL